MPSAISLVNDKCTGTNSLIKFYYGAHSLRCAVTAHSKTIHVKTERKYGICLSVDQPAQSPIGSPPKSKLSCAFFVVLSMLHSKLSPIAAVGVVGDDEEEEKEHEGGGR